MDIRELRADEIDDAVAFAAGLEQAIKPEHIEARKSLVIWDGDTLIGASLCVAQGGNRNDQRLHMLLEADRRDEEAMLRLMMDKALLKLRSCGVSLARIEPGPGMEVSTFWSLLNWHCYEQRQAEKGRKEPSLPVSMAS